MRVTRRQFVACAAAVAVAHWRIHDLSPAAPATSGIRILDLGNACSLRESVSGYERALGARAIESAALPAAPPATLIVPAAAALRPVVVAAIVDCLEAGGCVILETGLAFTHGEAVEPHWATLLDVFGIQIRSPVSLWSHAAASRIPYVDFTWPHAAKIRDYSHVVPLDARGDNVIASVEGVPVALMGSRDRGTLIFLGSPIGPALWVGDSEAKRWLDAVT